MDNDVSILDCTLRDGSYVNHFQFSTYETAFLCAELAAAGVKLIEVGHGMGLGAHRRGGNLAAAATDAEYLKAAVPAAKGAVVGMFCIPGYATLDDIDLAADLGLGLVRVGTNVGEVEEGNPFVKRAKRRGLLVATNYMKSYASTPAELAAKAKISQEAGADYVYIVDSAGGMLPDELEACVDGIRSRVDVKLGYHGHNNLGLAVANTILAAKKGVTLVDTSLQGLGRSSGNASTEQVLLLLDRMGMAQQVDVFRLMGLGFERVQPLISQVGLNPIEMVSGYALFHSSYMPLVNKYSCHYCVDPMELIIELCKVDQVNAPEELVDKIASGLAPKERGLFYGKYHLERYFVNEQG